MPAPTGFAWTRTKDGRVRISHNGRLATTLSGAHAARFLARAEDAHDAGAQQLMARATGNYKRVNERR